jgi:hypothetical protein
MSETIESIVGRQLGLAIAARSELWVSEGGFDREAHRVPETLAYDLTFACQSRCVELFDDCLNLLEKDRIPASATLARALIETIGFLALLRSEVMVTLPLDREAFGTNVWKMANSSDFKWRMQKYEQPREGEIYTEEAMARFDMPRERAVRPAAEAVAGLQSFLKAEISEGAAEIVFTTYSVLSEWSHPSQTSLMHAYTNLGAAVPSSLGMLRPIEAARHPVSWALAQMWVVIRCRSQIVSTLNLRFRELGMEVNTRLCSSSEPIDDLS